MLFPVKRLMIENTGYKRDISLKTIYINSSNVVSITDYDGAADFLAREESTLKVESFSLVKLNHTSDDLIVLGTAKEIYSRLKSQNEDQGILNG